MTNHSLVDGISGWISNIQRFSIDDGPGIRTTVFLKGCALNCLWCHNPECIPSEPQIFFNINHCTSCGACVAVCPSGAQQIVDGKRVFARDECQNCGACVEACLQLALQRVGKQLSVNEVFSEISRDRPFYDHSQGGVTISGGEPLMQSEFTTEILKRCHGEGIHTCVDTAGYGSWSVFESMLSFTDLFLYDLKCINREKHRALTGISNTIILENLRRLSRSGKSIWIRIPLIPGINDGIPDIHAFAEYIGHLDHIAKVQLIPYHKYGVAKYASLGLAYSLGDISEYTQEMKDALLATFIARGIPAQY